MLKRLFLFHEWLFFIAEKKKKNKQNVELFLCMLLKFEIIWTRIGQVI